MKRTKMIRILAILFALSITLSLAGCDNSATPTTPDEAPSVSQDATADSEDTTSQT